MTTLPDASTAMALADCESAPPKLLLQRCLPVESYFTRKTSDLASALVSPPPPKSTVPEKAPVTKILPLESSAVPKTYLLPPLPIVLLKAGVPSDLSPSHCGAAPPAPLVGLPLPFELVTKKSPPVPLALPTDPEAPPAPEAEGWKPLEPPVSSEQ